VTITFLTVTQFRTQTSFNAAETSPQGKPTPTLWLFVAQTTRRISPGQAAMCALQFLLPAARNLPEVWPHRLSPTTWLSSEEVSPFPVQKQTVPYVLVCIGPGGYVAAIKAAQLGLKACLTGSSHMIVSQLIPPLADGMYRETRCSWRNMSKCRLHSIKSHAQQFTPVPPSST
jgi:hypothetical protein